MKKVFVLSLAVVLVGCETFTSTSTFEARTPDGVRTDVVTENRHNRTQTTTVDSTAAYRDCLSQNAPTLGAAQADAYCRGRTQQGPAVLPQGGYGGGFIPGVSGALVPIPVGEYSLYQYPGMYAGNPQMYRGSGGVLPPMPIESEGSDESDVELLYESSMNHEERLCALERHAGRPCKK